MSSETPELPVVPGSLPFVRNVDAVVAPDEALRENLLGLSFLSRLRRFEYREGRLVLEE